MSGVPKQAQMLVMTSTSHVHGSLTCESSIYLSFTAAVRMQTWKRRWDVIASRQGAWNSRLPAVPHHFFDLQHLHHAMIQQEHS